MKNNALELTRQAGNIIRSHTNAQHGHKTVGEHTYNLVNIILLLNPDPSLNLIKAAMWHDVPERFTGDLPSPIKKKNPELGAALTKIEDKIMHEYGLEVTLTDDEKKWLKAADQLEYLCWAEDQKNLGNDTVTHAADYAKKWIEANAPQELVDYIKTPRALISHNQIINNKATHEQRMK